MSLFLVLAITAGVIGLAGRLPDARKVKRELALARVQSINQLVDGSAAAIRGTVAVSEAAGVTTSPLTRRRCVYWLIVFDEVGVGGDYHELGRTDGGVSFLLRSEAGTARIVPDHPRLGLAGESFSQPITQPGLLGELAKPVCKRHNYPTSWLRATEYVVEPDAFITVSGWCTREPDPEASESVSGYREQLPTRPVLSGSRRAKLLIG